VFPNLLATEELLTMKKFTGQQKLIDVSLAVATGEAAV
jgi:hypothetical protein